MLEIGAVVPLVSACSSAVDLHHSFGDAVEDVTVVGDQHEGAGIAIQPTLQPFDGGSIEMVGGLIQQQNIWARDKCGGEANPFAISA